MCPLLTDVSQMFLHNTVKMFSNSACDICKFVSVPFSTFCFLLLWFFFFFVILFMSQIKINPNLLLLSWHPHCFTLRTLIHCVEWPPRRILSFPFLFHVWLIWVHCIEIAKKRQKACHTDKYFARLSIVFLKPSALNSWPF